ncbi:MAG: type IV pili methyl-accepting chemotaxis transducer N-terminal domain-containing protein [Paracoccaceae bacterium]
MAIALFAATGSGYALPATAQDTLIQQVKLEIEDVGANARLDYSGRLRLFSQKIAADACYFASGLDTENAKALLIDAVAQFDRYIIALRDGDTDLGIIGPEKRSKTIKQIEITLALWAPYKAAGEALVAGVDAEKNLAFIAEQNTALLDQAIILASDINGEYANPAEMTQANAMMLDIAGRQRMLTQKMSKEACGVETSNPAFGTVEQLHGTMEMFDASLMALLNGMPDAGIIPAPTPELVASLQAAIDLWAPIKAELLIVEEVGTETADDAKIDLFNRLESLREDMKKITIQYREFALADI